MDSIKQSWNNYYAQETRLAADPWLLEYSAYFVGCPKVLDLGCGDGSNIPFLQSVNAQIVAIDYSQVAIDKIGKKWSVNAFVHDMRDSLPFGESTFDVILADLSLHYFSSPDTTRVVDELYRVSKDKGVLIARVNSVNDIKHGSGVGVEVERCFYNMQGRLKRFFDKEMIYEVFKDRFVVGKAVETSTSKYTDEKNLWEIVALKTM